MKKSLLFLCLLLTSVSGWAHDFVVDGIYYRIISKTDLTVCVTYKGKYSDSYSNEYTGSVTIPESVTYSGKTYSVTSIGNAAFSDCTGLTSVTIPESVTSIGESAFWHCTRLTSVTIPNSVTSIDAWAFSGCSGLTSVTIPNSVTEIDAQTFYNCSGLTSITIPNSVTSIGDYAFNGCTGLTSVTIPNSVTSIGASAFRGCTGLTSVTIGNSVTSIGSSAFRETGLTSVTIPNSVTSIGSYAFSGCTGLTSVEIPNSETTIGDYAFNGCEALISVTIPNSVTTIGNYAFNGCYFVYDLFINNSSLKNANMWGATLCDTETKDGLLIKETDVVKCRPWATSVTIPDGVTKIGNYAFNGCKALTSVTIPNSVTFIGGSAFYGCEALTSVTIPNSVTSIGSNVFSINTKLYVEANSKVLFDLWRSGNYIYDVNTHEPLVAPTLSGHSTGSSVEIGVSGYYPQFTYEISLNGNTYTYTGKNIKFCGLRSQANISVEMKVISSNGGSYSAGAKSFQTESLTLETQQPKVISEGNVIVAATSNLDDEEEKVGFEWRRNDWTDDFDSKTGGAYLYDGQMEGYIRSLNANYLWKFRPYYEANDGTRYYGEWKGLDPSDFSYFDPTVHTYNKIRVNGNVATVKGYAQRGTDNIVSQGFKYWISTASVKGEDGAQYAPSVPRDAQTVEASGTVMEAELTGLSYQTTYHYVAFVTTSEGETFYGEEMSFTTGEDPTGVEEMAMDKGQLAIPTGIYDLNGRRLARMQRGLNIVRYADGKVKKVMVK